MSDTTHPEPTRTKLITHRIKRTKAEDFRQKVADLVAYYQTRKPRAKP